MYCVIKTIWYYKNADYHLSGVLKSSTYADTFSAGSSPKIFSQSKLCGSKSLRTSNSMVTRYFCFCAWWNATDISVLLECYGVIIRCLRVNVKHLGGIYVPLWTFVGDLWGFCDPVGWQIAFLSVCLLRSQGLRGFIRYRDNNTPLCDTNSYHYHSYDTDTYRNQNKTFIFFNTFLIVF